MSGGVAGHDAGGESARQRAYWERDQSGRRGADHPAVRTMFEGRAAYIASLVEEARAASVVDVGCGNGFLTKRLEERFGRAVGVDLSEAMLAGNPCGEKVWASATALPFADGSFDVAVESHLLHHLTEEDRKAAVGELARVARVAVVMYEPNRSHPLMLAFGLSKREERMLLRFSGAYMRSLAEGAGLEDVRVRVEGLTVPNVAPAWWARLSAGLEGTFLRRLGVYTRTTGRPRGERR